MRVIIVGEKGLEELEKKVREAWAQGHSFSFLWPVTFKLRLEDGDEIEENQAKGG